MSEDAQAPIPQATFEEWRRQFRSVREACYAAAWGAVFAHAYRLHLKGCAPFDPHAKDALETIRSYQEDAARRGADAANDAVRAIERVENPPDEPPPSVASRIWGEP